MMEGLGLVDSLVIGGYLGLVTWLGIRMGRGVKRSADFFMPRKFGKAKMVMHAFGTGTASDQAVSVASATFQQGLSGIWYQWLWLFSTPFYWVIAPIMRRFRATTTADVFALRYDISVARLFVVIGIASMAVKIGVMLKGAGALVEAGTGGAIHADWAIAWCLTAIAAVAWYRSSIHPIPKGRARVVMFQPGSIELFQP